MSASSNETSSAAESTNQPAAQQPSTPLSSAGHGGLIRRLAEQDKTPVLVLILCALVGLLAGGVGVAFDRMVSRVKFERVDALTFMADYQVLVWIGVFLLSALLAAFGYFL
ncbi:MAG: hypothetical protein ACRCVR_02030, partial [Plesiomonas shigelloides]